MAAGLGRVRTVWPDMVLVVMLEVLLLVLLLVMVVLLLPNVLNI